MNHLKLIQETVNEALEGARQKEITGAINWGDLSCVEVCQCEDQDGDITIKILIEEADPINNELHEFVSNWLFLFGPGLYDADMEIRTEW